MTVAALSESPAVLMDASDRFKWPMTDDFWHEIP